MPIWTILRNVIAQLGVAASKTGTEASPTQHPAIAPTRDAERSKDASINSNCSVAVATATWSSSAIASAISITKNDAAAANSPSANPTTATKDDIKILIVKGRWWGRPMRRYLPLRTSSSPYFKPTSKTVSKPIKTSPDGATDTTNGTKNIPDLENVHISGPVQAMNVLCIGIELYAWPVMASPVVPQDQDQEKYKSEWTLVLRQTLNVYVLNSFPEVRCDVSGPTPGPLYTQTWKVRLGGGDEVEVSARLDLRSILSISATLFSPSADDNCGNRSNHGTGFRQTEAVAEVASPFYVYGPAATQPRIQDWEKVVHTGNVFDGNEHDGEGSKVGSVRISPRMTKPLRSILKTRKLEELD